VIEYERDTAAIAQLIAIVLSVAALILSALQRVRSNKTIAGGIWSDLNRTLIVSAMEIEADLHVALNRFSNGG